jgi:transposase
MAWTEITRAKYRREGLRYASETTDGEWSMIAAELPPAPKRGRPRTTPMRAVVDAIFYLAQTGRQWRLLPKELPPYTTVQRYFYAWRAGGVWLRLNHIFLRRTRRAEGRQASPAAGVMTANRSRPPRPAAHAALMLARKSKAANVIFSPTPVAC